MFRITAKKISFLSLIGVFISLVDYLGAGLTIAEELAPPKYQVVDRFGVNVTNAQVTTSLDTVSIGGSLGLSHSISTSTNTFIRHLGMTLSGVTDKYDGTARYELLAKTESGSPKSVYVGKYGRPPLRDIVNFYVMRVFDFTGAADFKLISNNQVIDYTICPGASCPSSYSFEAMGDIRNTLEICDMATLQVNSGNRDCLKWTKPDGTVSFFYRGANADATSKGVLKKVVYPNGFTITIYSDSSGNKYSVNTNTGFQLKYFYEQNYSGLPPEKAQYTYDSYITADSISWASKNPKSIKAINSAIEYCNPSVVTGGVFSSTCQNLTKNWPAATFNWPDGMPRAFYIGDSVFSVTNATNQTTIYNIRAFPSPTTEDGQPLSGPTYVPRLRNIKPVGSTLPTINYEYENKISGISNAFGIEIKAQAGVLKGASGIASNNNYIFWYPMSQGSFDFRNTSDQYGSGSNRIGVRFTQDLYGASSFVETPDGTYTMQTDYRNFPASFAAKNGPSKYFTYDDVNRRGNLTKVAIGSATSTETIEADYPTTCDNPKICNQAIWIKDAKGNKTWYTYHAESGQIAVVTYPANGQGKIAQTRYSYEQKYANYYNASGVKTQADTPIWLKTRESYCVNSNYSQGVCEGNDEVITTYEYNSDNLFLTGITITGVEPVNMLAPGGASNTTQVTTKRTCYQYDKYGNKIGETEPKAYLTQCAQQ